MSTMTTATTPYIDYTPVAKVPMAEVTNAINTAFLAGISKKKIAERSGVSRERVIYWSNNFGGGEVSERYATPVIRACQDLMAEQQRAYEADEYLVPAEPVRQHLQDLYDNGIRALHVSELIDNLVSERLIGEWKIRRTAPLSKNISDAILAISPDPRKRAASLIGAGRRLRALVAWGYPVSDVAAELGTDVDTVWAIMDDGLSAIDIDMRHRICTVFNRLEHIPGPSDKMRELGRERGWHLPMQWEEDSIDRNIAKTWRRRSAKSAGVINREEVLQAEFDELFADGPICGLKAVQSVA